MAVKAWGVRRAAGSATAGPLGWRPVEEDCDSAAAGGSRPAKREERLARALRDNLRRRKAQARAGRQDRTIDDDMPSDPSPLPDGGEA